MRLTRLIAVGSLIALGACGSPNPPGGFGINLTIDASGLDSSVRGQIAAARLSVTGDDPNPFSMPLDIASQLKSGQARFRYDPKVHAGTLTLHVDALDGSGTVISSGDSGPITLTDGQPANADIALGAAMPLDMSVGPDGGVDAAVDLAGLDLATPPDLTMPKNQGESCQSDAECSTGHCTDHVCCDSACADACHACNLTGFAGTCQPVGAGDAPASGHPLCGPDPVSGCQRDGTCDGKGACRLYQSGTPCSSPTCSAGTLTPASTCDGKGTCTPTASRSCAPYVCKDGQSCFGSCTSSADCSGTNACVNSSCGPKANGAQCTAGSECMSGYCAQQTCCDKPCNTTCMSCNQGGANLGKCSPVPPNGADPLGGCAKGSGLDATCAPGGCDGNGECLYALSTTSCVSASCTSGTETFPATCNGAGKCVVPSPATQACTPYICGATACKTTCASDSDCASGDYCNGTSCVTKLGPGGSCGTSNDKCASNLCVDGVCCTSACTNADSCSNGMMTTYSCATPTAGTCTGSTTSCGAYACGATSCKTSCTADSDCASGDYCNGTSCAGKLGPGASCGTSNDKCASNLCVDGVCCTSGCTTADSCSNGMVTTYSCATPTAGTCTGSTTSCGAYACGTTSCKTSCAADTDCASGYYCNASGSCAKKIAPGGSGCAADDQCQTGHCSPEQICCDTACTGQCEACNISGKVGTCSPVTGAPATGHTPCSTDGTAACAGSCDGSNTTACTYPAVQCRGELCGTNSISGQQYAQAFSYCSNGSCPNGTQTNCGAYACYLHSTSVGNIASCYTSCTTSSQCRSLYSCSSGTCQTVAGGP